MAKILFINPVVRQEDDPRHVPYGLALMSKVAMNAGHEVQVFDANAWRPTDEQLVQGIKSDDWDVVAIGGLTTTYGYVKKILKFIRNYSPRSLIVAGGGFLTSMPLDIMRLMPEIDVGVVGEGFVTFPEILKKIDGRDLDFSDTLGVVWRDKDGKVLLNKERPLVQDLDKAIPFPAWELFPLEIYFKNSSLLVSEESMLSRARLDINCSYGCSLICRFCWHLGLIGDIKTVKTSQGNDIAFTYDRTIRWHSPRYIVNLMKYAKESFGADYIMLLDENLMTMNKSTGGKWIPEICDLLMKEGLQPKCLREGKPHNPKTCDGIHWGGTSHAGLVDKDILGLMHEAGCTWLDYGLESFSNRVLKNVGKGSTAELNKRAIKITMDAGIRPTPNQIIGFPDEFFDSIRDDMKAWEEMGIIVYPFFATPYPGSEWYVRYKDKILAQYNGDLEAFLMDLGDATKITAVISENFNAVELMGIRELMVNGQIDKINEYEKIWRSIPGEPKLPDMTKADYYSIIEKKGVTVTEDDVKKAKIAVQTRH